MQRTVYIAFDQASKLPNRKVEIDRRGDIWSLAEAQVASEERVSIIGILDARQNNWLA